MLRFFSFWCLLHHRNTSWLFTEAHYSRFDKISRPCAIYLVPLSVPDNMIFWYFFDVSPQTPSLLRKESDKLCALRAFTHMCFTHQWYTPNASARLDVLPVINVRLPHLFFVLCCVVLIGIACLSLLTYILPYKAVLHVFSF